MTTPREQLIEAGIPRVSEQLRQPFAGTTADLARILIDEYNRALADLGVVVLMPVKATDLPFDERGYAECFMKGSLNKHGGAHLMQTVYINALEGEQS